MRTLWLRFFVAGSLGVGTFAASLADGDEVDLSCGNALAGRGQDKSRWIAEGGGNEPSERAVGLALKWLARHQMPDGGWCFNHILAPECHGQCRNPGQLAEARNAATGLALLPFLGAGETHKTGKYKEPVKRGLHFLVNNMKLSRRGALYETGGSMYSHGIASIALCEAYAMTHDKGLHAPAQQALNFVAYAQDPVGGGWRYEPRQKGDTSVTGWQVMALKSGHMADLRVPARTVMKASSFLDSVQANDGAHYGYTEPTAGAEATTAVGLLSRMYLGWKKDNSALERGVKWISDKGPSKNNMYYNYYATQVMRHWEGDPWKKWNSVMRDQLISSQTQKGHEEGSWFMPAGHVSDGGGRLYCTAMATMILEVYYRHLPIYRKPSADADSPTETDQSSPIPK
ncbi:MAG: prenyltransferase/squalene oxidase repeat-containing protein [Planctomycetota bacterium]